MSISYRTKRDIIDEFKVRDISYNGKLSEIDFANRLYNLKELPSEDPRYKTMESDFWQHRVNNYDWDYWWIIDDSRLGIINEDVKFGKFLCSMLHPITRSQEEVYALLEIMNSYLGSDGFRIVEDRKVYNGSTFKMIELDPNGFEVENETKTENDFVKEQYEKIDRKIKEEDFSGVITNSRTLIECVIGDIYKRIIGIELEPLGNLQDGYKKIKILLRLNPDSTSNEAFKSILRSFVTIVDGLDRLSNQMGDRHRPFTKAERNYAVFCANSAKTFVNFLYGVLEYQYGQKENLYNRFIEVLDSNKRIFSREELLADREISKLLEKTDPYLRGVLKKKLISDYQINSFRQSDIFFAFLRILFDVLVLEDISEIFKKCKENDQACGLYSFFNICKLANSNLVKGEEIEVYMSESEALEALVV